MVKYTNKETTQKKGLIKKGNSIYRQTLLEIFHAKGWLFYEESKYSEDERLKYGLLFMADCYKTFKSNNHSSVSITGKIDKVSHLNREMFMDAAKRYRMAIRNIPSEFWPIVRKICIEEIEPQPPKHYSERQKSYFYHQFRIDLCRGLDRIVEVYNRKLKLNKQCN